MNDLTAACTAALARIEGQYRGKFDGTLKSTKLDPAAAADPLVIQLRRALAAVPKEQTVESNMADKPIYKPSQVLRLVGSGQIADPQPKGTATIRCQPKGHAVPGDTESPTFWMNGSYVYCAHCGEQVLARVEFADFVIDLTGERKRYPDRVPPQT